MSKTHYFLALPLSVEVRQTVAHWTNELNQKLAFKSWVHPSDYHITLFFLGDAEFQVLQTLKRQLKAVVQYQAPFELQINQFGVFGNESSPRIFWAGLEENEHLKSFQKVVADICHEAGFRIEDRPYRPHITIARKWIGESAFPSQSVKEINVSRHEQVSWAVKEAVLYQTHLRRTPKYQPLSVFPFQ
ncbi:RNA 2',3'-cyclic phosphodiesterase [Anaerobacillus sp. MEB173]|uniref:RNA 2',3'-cyclic phosphodiesterase n=1 Tax=Anaerobacillus sp. MEB173 TaxID=3383345 RepID=UPI003F93311F